MLIRSYYRILGAFFGPIIILFLLLRESSANGREKKLVDICEDRFAECKDHLDDCAESPGWMTINCPKSCKTCHLRDPNVRCAPSFLNVSTEPSINPGDISRILTHIAQNENAQTLSTDPLIVMIDDFVSDLEISSLLDQVPSSGWERSHESGEINELGEGGKIFSAARTSSSFWCIHQCQKSSIVQQLTQRIELLLGISRENYEPVQLLKYEEGERYISHHDYSFEELRLLCGVRVITFFLYLSEVSEGGETAFPQLDLIVRPKKGRALIWANTLDHEPMLRDDRMSHEAKPVISGRKFAANIWVHSHEWTRPSLWACTGAETTY